MLAAKQVTVGRMASDDNTPVLVGAGQVTQREADPRAALAPVELMSAAARRAADDSGVARALLDALDTIVVIRSYSDTNPRFACPFGTYTNLPKSLAARLEANNVTRHIYTHPGGNMPQWCVNRLCEAVARGNVGSALVAGAEALATQKTAQRAGIALDWADDPGGAPEMWGIDRRGWSDVEAAHRMGSAICLYPLFENAIRGRRGATLADHQAAMGRLFEPFAAAAAANPLADRRAGYRADEIATPGPANPFIGFPYTRLLCADAYIDQGAALIVTSVGRARAAGVPRERWVYLHGCADAHDHWYVSDRKDYASSPAMRATFAETFAMADTDLDAIDAFDLYSCFPSAVEIACAELGLAEDDARGLTVTGGLPYFGGPGNNYVTHAIAEMLDRVRARPGTKGLVTANGNFVTKHSAGLYSTEPTATPFAPRDPVSYQAAIDADPGPRFTVLADGPATIETWTVMHNRTGPLYGVLVGRLADTTRFVANTPDDPALLADMTASEMLGAPGQVTNDGARNVFVPN